MSTTRLAIHGAAGRMGQRLVALAMADPDLTIGAALDNQDHPKLGTDAGQLAGAGAIGVPIADRLDAKVDCLIDFSVAAAVDGVIDLCRQQNLPCVIATTGISDDQRAAIAELAHTVPLVHAPNMSLAVNLTRKLAAVAAAALRDAPGGADVEIIERHHRFKQDAPSGTALWLGDTIAAEMGQSKQMHGRHGMIGERPRDEIGYHALRVGDNPGEHTIVFGLLGETIELSVSATNRDAYAIGALQAAKYIVHRPPGLYGMDDVLGI